MERAFTFSVQGQRGGGSMLKHLSLKIFKALHALMTQKIWVKFVCGKHRVEGISACMGLRRSLWQRLGGFDEMLGAGAPFKSAEEIDFTIRALIAGYYVYETPNVEVIHLGFRTWKQGRTLLHGYLYGIGAMFTKHLRCGHLSVVQVLLHLAWRWTFERLVVDFGHRPPRWLRLAAFVQEFADGAIIPVERATGHHMH